MTGWAYDPALREQLFGRCLPGAGASPCDTCPVRREVEVARERGRVLAGLPASEGEIAAGELVELRTELARARAEIDRLRAERSAAPGLEEHGG